MKNILITGATGFIGSRLLLELKRQSSRLKVKGERGRLDAPKIKILSRNPHHNYETGYDSNLGVELNCTMRR